MESHVAEVSGTLPGHVLPGVLLSLWALIWLAEDWRRPEAVGPEPLERGWLLPSLKVGLPLIAAWFELPNRGWYPADAVQGWHHISMYVGFAGTGAIDLLAREGRLPWGATYLGHAGAHLNAALLFVAHGGHGGVPGTAHTLLAWLFAVAACLALLEAARPRAGLRWLRIGALLSIGLWFNVAGWILYLSGWDMNDPSRVSWTYLLLSGVGLAVAAVLVVVRSLVGGSGAESEVVTA